MDHLDLPAALLRAFDARALVVAAVLFIPLERLRPLHGGQRTLRRWWRQDVVYVFGNGALVRAGLGILTSVILTASDSLVPAVWRAGVAGQPVWLQVLEAVVLADLGFYIAHRLFHAVPCLWRFHSIHHSIRELDWLAAVRVHALDQVVTRGVSLLPLLALGFDAATIAISSAIYFWHSLLLHANVRLDFGPLRRIIASPVFHHWHHAACPEASGKNFAGQLSILDTIFGTTYMPAGQEPQRYGVDDPVPHTYISQLAHPFKSHARRPKAVGSRAMDRSAPQG